LATDLAAVRADSPQRSSNVQRKVPMIRFADKDLSIKSNFGDVHEADPTLKRNRIRELLLGGVDSRHDFAELHLELKNTPPCLKFWFGTDELGRDVFTRIWWGARISLFIGVTAALIDATIGILFGTISAYVGGKTDELMMRFCDILYSVPYLLVVILLTVVRGSGLLTILIAMTCTGWINMARICRSQILKIKELDYVTAAKAMGASHARIIFIHMIPNAVAPVIAVMTLTIPTAIFTEAFLSFIGSSGKAYPVRHAKG